MARNVARSLVSLLGSLAVSGILQVQTAVADSFSEPAQENRAKFDISFLKRAGPANADSVASTKNIALVSVPTGEKVKSLDAAYFLFSSSATKEMRANFVYDSGKETGEMNFSLEDTCIPGSVAISRQNLEFSFKASEAHAIYFNNLELGDSKIATNLDPAEENSARAGISPTGKKMYLISSKYLDSPVLCAQELNDGKRDYKGVAATLPLKEVEGNLRNEAILCAKRAQDNFSWVKDKNYWMLGKNVHVYEIPFTEFPDFSVSNKFFQKIFNEIAFSATDNGQELRLGVKFDFAFTFPSAGTFLSEEKSAYSEFRYFLSSFPGKIMGNWEPDSMKKRFEMKPNSIVMKSTQVFKDRRGRDTKLTFQKDCNGASYDARLGRFYLDPIKGRYFEVRLEGDTPLNEMTFVNGFFTTDEVEKINAWETNDLPWRIGSSAKYNGSRKFLNGAYGKYASDRLDLARQPVVREKFYRRNN